MNIAFHKATNTRFTQFANLYCANHSALIDNNRDLPSLGDATLDPFSKEYQDMVIQAAISMTIVNFPQSRKLNLKPFYESMFTSSCCLELYFAELVTHEHNIDTGNAKPQYSTPYSHSHSHLHLPGGAFVYQ